MHTFINIAVDPCRRAVARRRCRRLLGEATPSLVGRIPNKVDTFAGSSSVVSQPSATVNGSRLDALSRWGQLVGESVLACEVMKRPDLQTGSIAFGASCDVNILRVGGGAGWGRNLRLDYVAFRDDGLADFETTAAACGTATLGSSTASLKPVPVSFNRTFSAVPTVHRTAQREPYADTCGVTVTNVTTTGFLANIQRADAPESGWSQNLLLVWLALG